MPSDVTLTATFRDKTVAEKINDAADAAGNGIAITAKKAVGVVAAVVGGLALGLNPVTGIAGLAAIVGTLASDALTAMGVTGSGLDDFTAAVNDVAETLSFAVADLSCATVWSANANAGNNNASDGALGQGANLVSEGVQANEATVNYDEDVNDAATSAEISGDDANVVLSTSDKVLGNLSKYGSRLGVAAVIGVSIYTEVEGGPNVGWDSSASAAWTGGGDVYNACIMSSEPSYLPQATSANGDSTSPSGH